MSTTLTYWDLITPELEDYKKVLELIAAPKRPDGTYNRCREACEKLAREVLDKYGDKGQL